jgi:glutamyl-tRNA(Gln) amidotransferase subunit D
MDGQVILLMLTSIAGEIIELESHNGYLILQGGIPEVERFVSSYWKQL